MRFLLSSLLLASLCALSSWSASSSLVVTQSPDVSVMEGETVNITCCWTGEVQSPRMWVIWRKNQTDFKKEIFNPEKHPEGSLLKKTPDCMNLTFTNITREKSGRYTCKITVDLPLVNNFEGNGTSITVTARDNNINNVTEEDTDHSGQKEPAGFPPQSVIIPLAVVTPLLVVALFCFCIQRRRQARVIYETPHVDSEVADEDKHSTSSSRGSTQWCQVPVYESFDYFEGVQTKKSG